MTTYPPLPFPPLPRPEVESRHAYGVRLLLWTLDTGITATLSDDQLDLAHHTAGQALTGRNVIVTGETAEETPAAVYDRLECLRRLLSLVMKARAAEKAAEPQKPAKLPPVAPGRQDGAKLAPLEPMPRSRPPAGQRVDIAFALVLAVLAGLATACASGSPTSPTTPAPVSQSITVPDCQIVHHDPICKLVPSNGQLVLLCTPATDERICR